MKRVKFNVFLLLCSFLIGFLSCGSPKNIKSISLDTTLESSIDELCVEQIEKSQLPGLVVSVVGPKGELWSNSYGYADITSKTKIDPAEHLFRIGSISKTITATALAKLNEEGELDIDLPIGEYYADVPADKSTLTLRQLGGHLGGIRHYRGLEFLSNVHYDDVYEPLEVFIQDTLLCVPGTAFNYSTYGWTLISAVMQSGVAKPFVDIIEDAVSGPLALDDLKPDEKDSTHYQRVSFYHLDDGQLKVAPEVDLSNKWAGGGYLCSAEDLSAFGYAVLNTNYLKSKSLEEFSKSQTTASGEVTNYGIGFNERNDKQGRRWIGHSGGSIGGTSMLMIYPDDDLVVVTLVNMGGAKMENLAGRIAELFLAQTD